MKTLVLGSGFLFVALGLALPGTSDRPTEKKRKVDFNRDVRPILSEHCYKCHGPSAKDGMAGLRLDLKESALKNRDGEFAIKPGSPAHSLAFQRIITKDKDAVMPPPDSGGKPMTAAEVETLKAWIESGAEYKKHWAFIPPTLPEPPSVSDPSWCRNEVDRFVLAGLDEAGLKPAAEAPPHVLLRRAALTLTGMPPTDEDVKAFEADKSGRAYENAVDRFLASPRYGEHQARYWLDAVRYGDTHGMHIDNERAIYPYRDWVVRAYNQDLPFDKFTMYQMAGDMLPKPTEDQLIASGYIRMNPTTNEGGVIEEEFLVRNTFDRVDTTSTVFLGMTTGCAKCHSHKYDPISHKDYYGLFAFFNSTKDAPLDGNLRTPDPVMKAPTPEQKQKLSLLNSTIRGYLDQTDADASKTWLLANLPVIPKVGQWTFAGPYTYKTFDIAYDTEVEKRDEKPITIREGEATKFTKEAEDAIGYYRTTLIAGDSRPVTFRLNSDDAVKVWLNGQLVHANKALRGVDQATDLVTLNLKQGENDLLVKVINATGPNGFRFRMGTDSEIERFRVMNSGSKDDLRDLYLRQGPETGIAKQYRLMVAEKAKIEAEVPFTLIAQELPMPRKAYLLKRGEYNLRDEEVGRAIPAAFGTFPKNAPLNRVGLGEWLVSPENPLTFRVLVNRLWQQHFGTGIVKTAEDFGAQGEWPSHPELLDYLAVRYRIDGMSTKKFHRLLLTSSAFRQASVLTPDKQKKDPENRLISRGPRFRLDAEVLRDSVLAVSGLINEVKGGRGFRPYQPPGLWEELGFDPSVSDTSVYKMDETDAIYRRTLYLFWKRTSPHPIMQTFDAPSREACAVRRARTNTPMQALLTMNEPAFLESSRVFAEKLVRCDASDEERLRMAYQEALGRMPSAKEMQVLSASFQRSYDRFKKDPKAAEAVAKTGLAKRDMKLDAVDVAAWTLVTNTIFNTDEFLTQH